jgi:hypothetical protein
MGVVAQDVACNGSAGRDRLAGKIEVDKTYVGGSEEAVVGRQTERKALIVVAAQENGRGIGRVRMRRIPDASADSLTAFTEDAVAPGSVVNTDSWLGYARSEAKGYLHQVTFIRGNKRTPSELLPRGVVKKFRRPVIVRA